MVWTKVILAALLVVGFVLAAEEIQEKIDSGLPAGSSQEGDKKFGERRDGAQPPPHFKQPPPPPQGNLGPQKNPIQHESIPVPLIIPMNGGTVMIPPLHQPPPPLPQPPPHKERQPPPPQGQKYQEPHGHFNQERPPPPPSQGHKERPPQGHKERPLPPPPPQQHKERPLPPPPAQQHKERPLPPPPPQQHKERPPPPPHHPQGAKFQEAHPHFNQDRQGQQGQIYISQEHFVREHQGQPNQNFQNHQPLAAQHVQIHLVQAQQNPNFQDHQGHHFQEHHNAQGQVFQDPPEVLFQGHRVQRPQAQKLEDHLRHQAQLASEHQEQYQGHQNPPDQVYQDHPELHFQGHRDQNSPQQHEEIHQRIQGHLHPDQQDDFQAQHTFQTYHIQEVPVQDHHEPTGHQFHSNEVEHPDAAHQNQIQPVYPGNDGGGYGHDPHNHQFHGFPALPGSDTWPLPQPEMPKVKHIDVHCEKNQMKVTIEFDKPFHGIIFSKGHYNNPKCVHQHSGGGSYRSEFDILAASCGTLGNTQGGLYGNAHSGESGAHLENTVIIQYDPQVQEMWDDARKLRCMWHDHYEKIVTFNPFPVGMLDVVQKSFAGDNVGCWMQIQVGKGPWATEVAGIVRIGQTMTMVLAIQDKENKFDMMVRNCVAHDGKKNPIELVNSQGCIMRPKLMSRFTKIKNFGSSASVLSYAHFQAFKFPDSMEVHFQCTIQICRPHCPEQCGDQFQSQNDYYHAPSINYGSVGRPREERDLSAKAENVEEVTEVGVNRVIRVVSREDLAFVVPQNETLPMYYSYEKDPDNIICMSTPGFAASLVVLLAILVISCLVAAFLCLRQRSGRKDMIGVAPHVAKCTL